MIKLALNWILKTVVGRWVTLGVVTVLLGGVAIKWHNYKEGLIHKGQQVCVQEINKETVAQLEAALAEEKETAKTLRAMVVAKAAENEAARERLRAATSKVQELQAQREAQEKTDETYADWSNTPLPAGVPDRLRNLRTGSN